MATYVLPQVLVFQDFTISPAVAANPLSAYIAGGNAYLTRTDDADEKEKGFLGYYDNAIDETFSWPNRPAGALVDTAYTKLYIENALLKYLDDPLSSGNLVNKVTNRNNRIKSLSYNFASNGASYPRAATLYDRDVQLGDVIRVRAVPDGQDPVVLWTSVKDVVAEDVAAVVSAATKDDANPGDQTAAQTVTKVAGPDNCVTAAADNLYDGLADGYVSETYTVTVTDSSTGGDFTTARLRVLSASGTDDVSDVVPAANGAKTAIGTRDLGVTFADDDTAACSLSADNDSVTDNDLIAGQSWTVAVNMTWNSPSPTSGSVDYTSENDTTYIIEVSRGAMYADTVKPQIMVTTSNGVDQSGPHTVSAGNTDVTIGTQTVTIQFDEPGYGLNKGDRYYIPVVGVKAGPMRIIELADNLGDTLADTQEVGIELYIRNPLLEVSKNRAGYAPVTNFQENATQITVENGIIAYDDSWTDAGVALPLDVFSCPGCLYGKMYVTYRAWEVAKANVINSITDVGDIDDIPGSLTPDNPLKWGVYKALTNNNGTPVLYTAVTDPSDADDWDEILELAQSRDDIHALVPLTRDGTVQGLYQAHVNAMSTETAGLWRTAWFNLNGVPKIPLVSAGSDVSGHTQATTTDGEECLAVFEDDPLSTGTQYTQVRNASGNGRFLTNGVRAGDIIRAQYSGDGFGNYTYSEYVVDQVQSEEQLLVKTGPSVPISTPAKIEIWRNLTLTEEAAEIAKDAGAFNSRRILAIWPDEIESSGTIQEGYHLAAALAALTSGVLPQQGLTRLAVHGFSDVQRTARFSKSQLDTMALSGTWIVIQDPDGNIYSRQAITTGNYSDINQREEMLTRNVDSISYRFKDYFEPFIGITNVTPSMEAVIRTGISTLITVLQTERFTINLGGQLIDATLETFEVHPIFKDRYVAKILLTVPYALNNLELHLVV